VSREPAGAVVKQQQPWAGCPVCGAHVDEQTGGPPNAVTRTYTHDEVQTLAHQAHLLEANRDHWKAEAERLAAELEVVKRTLNPIALSRRARAGANVA
jgi:hypothetical protein